MNFKLWLEEKSFTQVDIRATIEMVNCEERAVNYYALLRKLHHSNPKADISPPWRVGIGDTDILIFEVTYFLPKDTTIQDMTRARGLIFSNDRSIENQLKYEDKLKDMMLAYKSMMNILTMPFKSKFSSERIISKLDTRLFFNGQLLEHLVLPPQGNFGNGNDWDDNDDDWPSPKPPKPPVKKSPTPNPFLISM